MGDQAHLPTAEMSVRSEETSTSKSTITINNRRFVKNNPNRTQGPEIKTRDELKQLQDNGCWRLSKDINGNIRGGFNREPGCSSASLSKYAPPGCAYQLLKRHTEKTLSSRRSDHFAASDSPDKPKTTFKQYERCNGISNTSTADSFPVTTAGCRNPHSVPMVRVERNVRPEKPASDSLSFKTKCSLMQECADDEGEFSALKGCSTYEIKDKENNSGQRKLDARLVLARPDAHSKTKDIEQTVQMTDGERADLRTDQFPSDKQSIGMNTALKLSSATAAASDRNIETPTEEQHCLHSKIQHTYHSKSPQHTAGEPAVCTYCTPAAHSHADHRPFHNRNAQNGAETTHSGSFKTTVTCAVDQMRRLDSMSEKCNTDVVITSPIGNTHDLELEQSGRGKEGERLLPNYNELLLSPLEKVDVSFDHDSMTERSVTKNKMPIAVEQCLHIGTVRTVLGDCPLGPTTTSQTDAMMKALQREMTSTTPQADTTSEAHQTQAKSKTHQPQATPTTLQTEAKSKTQQTEATSKAQQTEATSKAQQTEATSKTHQTEATSETHHTEATSETQQTEATSETHKTHATPTTLQTRGTRETQQTEATPTTLQTEATSKRLQTDATPKTLQTEATSKTLQTEATSDTLQTEVTPTTLQTEATLKTLQTEATSETEQLEVMSNTLQTEVTLKTLQTETTSETRQTEVTSKMLQTEIMSKAHQAEAMSKIQQAVVATKTLQTETASTLAGQRCNVTALSEEGGSKKDNRDEAGNAAGFVFFEKPTVVSDISSSLLPGEPADKTEFKTNADNKQSSVSLERGRYYDAEGHSMLLNSTGDCSAPSPVNYENLRHLHDVLARKPDDKFYLDCGKSASLRHIEAAAVDMIILNPISAIPRSQLVFWEIWRLSTFSALEDLAVFAIRLAQTGFYYDEELDEIRCFSCNVTKRRWSKTESPAVVHLVLSPDCDHANMRDGRNVPISEESQVLLPNTEGSAGAVEGWDVLQQDSDQTDASASTQSMPSAAADPTSAERRNLQNDSKERAVSAGPATTRDTNADGRPSEPISTAAGRLPSLPQPSAQNQTLPTQNSFVGLPSGSVASAPQVKTASPSAGPPSQNSATSSAPTVSKPLGAGEQSPSRYPVQVEQAPYATPNQHCHSHGSFEDSGVQEDNQETADGDGRPATGGLDMRRAINPAYATVSKRMATFSDWPSTGKPSSRVLVLAGFHYTGWWARLLAVVVLVVVVVVVVVSSKY